MTSRLTLTLVLLATVAPAAAAQQAPDAQAAPAAATLTTQIGRLGSLDYPVRMNAARLVRRATAAEAVPALTQAVRSHSDEFIRYRALVLLTSFSDRGTGDLVRQVLTDRNDRLREVAYKWLEQHPDAQLAPTLLAALQTETAEFVRPALVGALAALGDDPQVQRALLAETLRGLDFFRSAVIDALGRHKAEYAVETIAKVAQLEGPLQPDAVLALGRIGGPRAIAALSALKQPDPDVALTLRGAQCLAGTDCDVHVKALLDAAGTPGAGPAVARPAVSALSVVAASGHPAALDALAELAGRGRVVREQAAVGLASAAVRAPGILITWLERAPEAGRATIIELLKDGFDRLDEDYAEEQFFAATRAAYWAGAEGSGTRTLTAALIEKLEF